MQLHLIGMKVCACCSVLREAALFYEYESCPFLLSKIAFPLLSLLMRQVLNIILITPVELK